MDNLSYISPAEPIATNAPATDFNEIATRIPKRFSFSVDERSDDAIEVYLRIKPEVESESFQDGVLSFVEDDNSLMVKKKKTVSKYKFTHIFKPDTTQDEVFSITATTGLQDLFKGRNTFLFTYGTSSSGKTFTIQGTKKHPGLIPRIIAYIFSSLDNAIDDFLFYCPERSSSIIRLSENELIQKLNMKDCLIMWTKTARQIFSKTGHILLKDLQNLKTKMKNLDVSLQEDAVFSIWVSFAEIYNEKIYELLEEPKDEKTPLSLATDVDKGAFIKGLRHIPVSTLEEAYLLYLFGCHNRSVHYTALNDKSSRSHSIFSIKIVCRTRGSEDVNFASSFSICDLAGTERSTKTKNYGSRMKESQNINTSFLVLNRCLRIIRENQLSDIKQIVPYRESKLTQIMGRSFCSGDTNLKMIVTITQAQNLMQETEASLKSSAVATEIKASLPIPIQKKKLMRFSAAFAHLDPGLRVNWNELLTEQAGGSGLHSQHSDMALIKQLEIEKSRRKEAENRLVNMEKIYQDELEKFSEERRSMLVKLKETEVAQSQKEYETLKQQFDELHENYMESRANCLSTKKRLRLLKEDHEELQKNNKSLESINDKLEEMLNDAKEEVGTLHQELNQLNQTLVKKYDELASKDEKIATLEMELAFLEENLIHFSEERNVYDRLISTLENELKERTKELEELKQLTEDYPLIRLETPIMKSRSEECLNTFSPSPDPAFLLPVPKSKTTAKKKKKRLVKDLESSYYFDDDNKQNTQMPTRRKLYGKTSEDELALSEATTSQSGDNTQASPNTIFRTLRTGKKY